MMIDDELYYLGLDYYNDNVIYNFWLQMNGTPFETTLHTPIRCYTLTFQVLFNEIRIKKDFITRSLEIFILLL